MAWSRNEKLMKELLDFMRQKSDMKAREIDYFYGDLFK